MVGQVQSDTNFPVVAGFLAAFTEELPTKKEIEAQFE